MSKILILKTFTLGCSVFRQGGVYEMDATWYRDAYHKQLNYHEKLFEDTEDNN